MTTRMEFSEAPTGWPMLVKAAISRKPGLKEGEDIGRFEAAVQGVSTAGLSEYQDICGFPRSDILPITFPQVVASPLHLAILTHKSFPLPAMGLVHVSSRITQERGIRADESLDVNCWVEGQRPARKGCEADLITQVSVGGELVWESITTVLSRAAKGHGEKSAAPPVPEPVPSRSTVWKMKTDLGRRYSAIAGDRNPIHLYAWSAKLLGFRRHIIHGMWLLARAMAELDDDCGDGRLVVDVSFKRPVFLPGRASFLSGPHEKGTAFRLLHPETEKVHLYGQVTTG
ncbi:MAG: acyl dehydratase [Deltaproteobacteria bacterium]|nr:acyl dehydratase [Deltaproteobacteria bacterium]